MRLTEPGMDEIDRHCEVRLKVLPFRRIQRERLKDQLKEMNKQDVV